MTLGMGDRCLFVKGNLVFDGAEPDLTQCSAWDLFYPPLNALDCRPNRALRFSAPNGVAQQDLVFTLHSYVPQNSILTPDVIAILNFANNTLADGAQMDEDQLGFRISTSPNGTTWTNQAWKYPSVADGRDWLWDMAEAGVSAGARQRLWWKIGVKAASGNIKYSQIGTVILGARYIPPRDTVLLGLQTEIVNPSVVVSDSGSSVLLHRSAAPARVIRGAFHCNTAAQALEVINGISGKDYRLLQKYYNFRERMNWPTCFVPPMNWETTSSHTVATPIFGVIEGARITSNHPSSHVVEFDFREIPTGGE